MFVLNLGTCFREPFITYDDINYGWCRRGEKHLLHKSTPLFFSISVPNQGLSEYTIMITILVPDFTTHSISSSSPPSSQPHQPSPPTPSSTPPSSANTPPPTP